MKSQWDVITIGGATRDLMFYSSEGELVTTDNLTKHKMLAFEYGAKILADKIYFSFGGGAANAAATFASLGLATAVVSRVGADDAGQHVLANFKRRGIDQRFVTRDRNRDTGFSMILTVSDTSREHIAFLYRGANDTLTARAIPWAKLTTSWFYISSLPQAGWLPILREATSSGKHIAWNPGSQQLHELSRLKRFLPQIKVLIINRDEALEFKKLKNTKGLLKYIHSLGSALVVITDGERGAYAYDGATYHYMKAAKSKSLDTIGIGDAFGAALVAALIRGKGIKEALRWGTLNAASVVRQIGAQNGILTSHHLK